MGVRWPWTRRKSTPPAGTPRPLGEWTLDTGRFLRLLDRMIGVGEQLQNAPSLSPPREDAAADFVLRELAPYVGRGGLQVERVSYAAGRSNLILRYPGRTQRSVAFVGAHFDVVPAEAKDWQRPPFALRVEGDRLFGRGVSDCLGHVAVLTDLFAQLADSGRTLDHTVVAVLIADEELSNTHGVGIGRLVRDGRLAALEHGPLYWIDSTDFGPTTATAGLGLWRLVVDGQAAHSGFPKNGINAAELATEVTRALQAWFYAHYPAHPNEAAYGFRAPSSFKPTRVRVDNETLTAIPGRAIVEGDIRLTPWYDPNEVRDGFRAFLETLRIDQLPAFGPGGYTLGSRVGTARFDLLGAPSGGMACDRDSAGYAALADAVAAVRPASRPFALTGSLPYVKFLQEHGFDVQITGFGRDEAYHAPNEFAHLSDMQDGFRVLCRILDAFG